MNRFGGAGAGPLATGVLWAGLLAAVIIAIVRARPAGLFRFTAQDILWGIGFGAILRLTQGLLSDPGTMIFPRSDALSTSPYRWLVGEAIPATVFGPNVEELFFRAVLLVTVYQMLRRSIGPLSAAVTASLASAGAFVCLHAAFGPLDLADGLQFFLVGLTCSLLVFLTGRVWGAVVAHVVYNVTYLALVVIGTVFSR